MKKRDMREKKEIEELSDFFHSVDRTSYLGGPIRVMNYDALALACYDAGYRKQKRGEWELGRSGCMYYCSECKYAAHPREVDEWSHCPNCGAKMGGGAE